jgi:hypothetical protein
VKKAVLIAAVLLLAGCTRGYGVDPLLVPPEANADANAST